MIAIDRLRRLISYNPETGDLLWRPREASDVRSQKSGEVVRWNNRYAGKPALTAKNGTGYRTGAIDKKAVVAHKVAFALGAGYWPEGEVDHINGNLDDLRFANLREVTPQENQRNRATPSNNTSGHIGVSWNARDKRWCANIGCDGRRINLGTFINRDDAIAARLAAQRDLGFHENHGRARS